ncbi:uncharacterized protein ACLA_061430 [Aspergillus clavatus NRRL 1]|uniref:Uncharacterized protein n=1 Tax=Aspergillus clavatus (strain ATCC 1007 / CBS 513.65 / DSM 816 / NCTC 3887 / NRRL 1 / QM 1276 / 107) TaxID=344612 RepID=A1CCC4_ASPCL|nr:uncharacterized protein ACLA_061430 [Aspergillus clavatus NRRL 1]EAW12181.1 hypothetical protein ACLA_061430 [Aspergillus clavatus NRRL 1]
MGTFSERDVSIKTLRLDVCTRTGIPQDLLGPPDISFQEGVETPRCRTAKDDLRKLNRATATVHKMHPDYLLAALKHILEMVLYWPYRNVIYEHVGSVMFLLDGRLLEWDLTEYLQKMWSEDEDHAQWRQGVLVQRKNIGFCADNMLPKEGT